VSQTYDNTNKAVLFKNHKRTTDKHPEYTGHGEVDCPTCNRAIAFRLAAWVRESKKGTKFFSMALTDAEATGEQPAADL
jgi:hypothetical protein